MNLKLQKRLAANLLKSSKKRIKLDPASLNDISESITKTDIRELIGDGTIKVKQKKGVSRIRANKRRAQYRKGLRRGWGSSKGTPHARQSKKSRWIGKVRIQRTFVKELKEKKILDQKDSRKLYDMVKGGFFRSKRHIKLYIDEHNLAKKVSKK